MLFGIVPKQPSACRGHILRRGQLNGVGEPLDFGLASDTRSVVENCGTR